MREISPAEFAEKIPPEELHSGPIFGAISSDAIRFLINNGKLFTVPKGDHVFRYGDKGDHFFIVCKGHIDFLKHHEGEVLHTRCIGFGEELGFVPMIALHNHTGEAIAGEESILLEVSSALFSELHEKYPFDFGVITLNLARDMARVIRKLSNALVENSIKH